MQKIIATIITIGDELLIGQTVDTNSAWMAKELNKAGIWVHRRVAVGDDRNAIIKALNEESVAAPIILITGGLGPTADDITKPLLCAYFNGKMIVNPEALENVKLIFEKMLKRPLLERNLKQAEVPDTCTVIPNRRGTAPGMWFEKEGTIFVSMPGVPFEMMGMMTDTVIPKLLTLFQPPPVLHRTMLTAGIGESFIAEKLLEFEPNLPPHIKLAYLPDYGLVRLRLTATGAEANNDEIDGYFNTLQSLLNDVMVTNEDEPLEKALGKLLLQRGKTLATAESCTGGYMAHLITSIPGSSDYFKGSVVSYSNEIKENVLGVQKSTLETKGAVSEETVREMVTGLLHLMKTDFGIAVSGIMGPGGGSAEKPTGTVWVAVGYKGFIQTQKFHFRFNRERNIRLSAIAALELLRKLVVSGS
jgi:nicotinamide-nucleotide amidase